MAGSRIDPSVFRALLNRRLSEVLRRNATVNPHLRQAAGLPPDWEERAEMLADRSALDGLDVEAREEIAATRAALRRIDEGTYGLCGRCGRPIAEARLWVLPLVLTCVPCSAS